MSRQQLVHERVVAREQLRHAAVYADDAFEKHLTLSPHGLAKIFVEVRKDRTFGSLALQRAQPEPLAREILHEFLRASIRQHATRLLLQDLGVFQLSLA